MKRGDKFMKTIKQITLLAVCALATVAFAQQNPPPQGGGEDQGRPEWQRFDGVQ